MAAEHSTTTHPLDHPLLPIWLGILARCHNPKAQSFEHYGGRGIQVSLRWLIFINFASDMGPRPTPQHSVERRDVNAGYGRENCYWATATEQNRNTRKTIWLTFKGEKRSLPEWAERIGMNPITLATRIKRGWAVDVALTALTTKDGYGKRVRQRRTNELCAAAGMARGTFYYRLSKGWSEHDALTAPLYSRTKLRLEWKEPPNPNPV